MVNRPERRNRYSSPAAAADTPHGGNSDGGGGRRFPTRFLVLVGVLVIATARLVEVPTLSPSDRGTTTSRNDGCMSKAREANAAHLKQHLTRFWGKEPYIEVLLERLGKEPIAKDWDTFIDVGAGAYSTTGGDISLSLLFDTLFPAPAKQVFAFEPFKDAYDKLNEEYQGYLVKHQDRKGSLQYNLINKGVGRDEQPQEFRGKGNVMTANKRIAVHGKYMIVEAMTIESMSIQALNLPHINLLKTDTEGLEWEVLLGAKPLIKSKNIDLIFFAYEDKWTFDSFSAAYPLRPFLIKDQEDMDTPNLQSVSTWLEKMGYDTYLIGLAPEGQEGFVALPVTGAYWNNTFEVGRDPKSYGYHYTWMDAMAVQKGSPLQDWIEQQSQPHAKICH